MIEKKTISITTQDGFELSAIQVGKENAKATVQFNSATGVKKEYYLKFAEFLASHDYRVLLYDYRGIGQSRPSSLKDFQAHMHEWGEKDMSSVTDFIRANFPGQPLAVIGHSVGGQLLGVIDHHTSFSKAILLNCSTGYWKHMASPYKYFTWIIWNIILPTTIPVVGYLPAKSFRQGENLPAGVAKEWKSWCVRENYFGDYLEKQHHQDRFYDFKTPIISLYPTDDDIATDRTVERLLSFYPNAPQRVIKWKPEDLDVKKIGHFGFFHRSVRDKAWPKILQLLEE